MKKNDYYIAAFIGFFAGIFAIPIVLNVGFAERILLLGMPWIGAAGLAAAVFLGGVLGRRIMIFVQFSRFAAVGILNTAIDFGILNTLSLVSGATAGLVIGGVNLPGFSIAVFNSYLWNKLWVFQDRPHGEKLFHDFPRFLMVTGVGVVVNSALVVILTTYGGPLVDIEPARWLNIAKVMATAVTFLWNFTGYKFIVFRQARPL